MTEPVIISTLSLDDYDLGPLRLEARSEGFTFVDRLIDEWASGSNHFNRKGEKLLGAFSADQVIAFGGINQDPYTKENVGRVRHLFVSTKCRGLGIGRTLISHLLVDAGDNFSRVRLRTTTFKAARFYQNAGFSGVGDQNATHEIDVTGMT